VFPGFLRFLVRKGLEMPAGKKEHHHIGRIGWMRAAVLGANDGILTTSSLVLGVAAAHATHRNLLIAGMAGLVAGAMSMAAGEYVSVHSQEDTEHADLDLERTELKTDNKGEHEELAAIYVARGLDPFLAKQVAQAAHAGGAGVMIGAFRVTFWGGLAMATTAGIGWIFGAVV
jgi:vacuolar iron transporter family protein